MVYTSEHPIFYVTADIVAFALRHGELAVLLVERGGEPYRGCWALPGGFVDEHEPLEAAARRELREETGVAGDHLRFEQLGAFGDPGRDPRHRVVSVAFGVVLPPGHDPAAADDAADAEWRPVSELDGKTLAFDHRQILDTALSWLTARLEDTDLAAAFLPEEFTVTELREVYEAVWGRPLDAGNFQRKVTGAECFLVESGRRPATGPGRPATLYRRGSAGTLWPPLSRTTDQ